MSSGLNKILFPLLLYFTINYSRSLSITLNASMHSVNMKHILKWSLLQASCSMANYSVQFQGEYELYNLNATWVDAYDCQEIIENWCDLTHDLASNSDYSIRIETNCDGQKSWAQLPATFNRKDTVLLVPKMIINVEGDPVQVGFSTTLSDVTVNLKVWQEGDEQNALIYVIRDYPYNFSIAAQRGKEKMCFKAEALVEAANKSCSTDTQCVIIPKQIPDFMRPLMMGISVVIAVTVAFILGWLAKHFGPKIKQTFCQRETIPNVLFDDWPTRTPILFTDVSLEPTDPLLLLLPAEHQCTVEFRGNQLNEVECRT
ncbi:cytokine receptor family member B16 isoform X1 [Carassius carassius]|uniref:cytokine receptor family member B16 isoform X1 n=1 Tax=Carassius carassius TaxID=217509 RepID=UPI0028684BFF|nr:cytokine receptor family member B16 isoform X1 [Carassius carassius]